MNRSGTPAAGGGGAASPGDGDSPAASTGDAPAAGAAEALTGGRSRLRRIFLYGLARGMTEGLLSARGFFLAWLLGPTGYGGWALFRLVTRYVRIGGLGVERGLEYEVGRVDADAGGGERREAERFARTALGFMIVSFGLLSVVTAAVSFLTSESELTVGLRAVAAMLVASGAGTYAMVYMRARGQLRRFSALEVLKAGIHLLLAAVGALLHGLSGALAGFVLATVVSTAVMLRHVPARPLLSRARLRRLVRVGFPLMSDESLATALATADRFVVAALGGVTLLGHYAFAAAVAGLASVFASVVRTVVFPDVYGHAEAEGAEAAVREHMRGLVLPFARLYPPVLGALALAIGPAVRLLMPEYAPAAAPARIFIFTGVAFGFSSLASLSAVTVDRQKVLPLFSGAALLLDVGLSALALRAGAGLIGVAAAALFSRTAHGTALLVVSARAGDLPAPRRFLLRATLPLAYCVAVVAVLGGHLPGADPIPVGASFLWYAVLLVPLIPSIRDGVRELSARGTLA